MFGGRGKAGFVVGAGGVVRAVGGVVGACGVEGFSSAAGVELAREADVSARVLAAATGLLSPGAPGAVVAKTDGSEVVVGAAPAVDVLTVVVVVSAGGPLEAVADDRCLSASAPPTKSATRTRPPAASVIAVHGVRFGRGAAGAWLSTVA
jgi:hypothetical protein